MEVYQDVVDLLRIFALAAGSFVVSVGVVQAALVARGPGGRERVARRMLGHAALGLDFFIAATLLNLAIDSSWPAVAATALTIAVRKLLTFSLGLGRRGP